jgi:putative oxidoreductase
MKIVAIIARILLGFVFFAAGSFSLLKLGKISGVPSDATAFLMLMLAHHYTTAVALVMFAGGLLLLAGRFVPIGLVLLGPVLVNILLFHSLFHAPGIATGAVCSVLEIFLIWVYWPSFRALFVAKAERRAL